MKRSPGVKLFEAIKSYNSWSNAKFSDDKLEEILEGFNIPLALADRKSNHKKMSEIENVLAMLSAIHYDMHGNHIDYPTEDDLLEHMYEKVYGEKYSSR